jgi:hypothetical protein
MHRPSKGKQYHVMSKHEGLHQMAGKFEVCEVDLLSFALALMSASFDFPAFAQSCPVASLALLIFL